MEDTEILDIIYELEEPIIKSNNFESLFINVDDILNLYQSKFTPSATIDDLTIILNNLWLHGQILRFLSEDLDLGLQQDSNNYYKSEELHRDLFISDNIIKVRSRVAEIIRLLSFNRMRGEPRNSSIATLNYVKDYKEIPHRYEPILKFKDLLINEIKNGVSDFNNFYTVPPNVQQKLIDSCEIVSFAINDYALEEFKGEFKCSKFQMESIISFLRATYFKTKIYGKWKAYPIRNLIISAGVGSGKTFAFIIGPLIDVLTKMQYDPSGGVLCLVLYPRISLVQDQYVTINKIVQKINQLLRSRKYPGTMRILMEAAGKIKDIASDLVKEDLRSLTPAIEICYKQYPHQIVLGTLETIKRRVMNPICSRELLQNLRTIIFDEIHLLNGLQGNHTILFSKRIKALIHKYNSNFYPKLFFIGASATIANPIKHAAKIFGDIKDFSKIGLIRPNEDDLVESGIYHHIMLKPYKGSNLNAVLTNMTSLLIHNRRNGLKFEFEHDRPEDVNKTIFFADSLNIIGRMNYLIRDNEFMDMKKIGEQVNPFYIWFFEPLRKHSLSTKSTKTRFPGLEKVCDDCKAGKQFRFSLNLTTDDKNYLSKLRNSRNAVNIKVQDIYEYLADQENPLTIGGLENCFYFQKGCCWWFSQDSEIKELIFPNPIIEHYPGPIKNLTLTSGTEEDFEQSVGSIENYFREQNYKLYNNVSRDLYRSHKDFLNSSSNLNLLISSPKIEVGVDFKHVKEGIGFKAIRNLSSYHQKMGRIGREIGSESLLVTVLSFRPEDHYYFRNIYKLTNTAYLEPIPLKGFNSSVISSQIFMSIFDFIVSENIPSYGYRLFLILKSEADYASFPQKIRAVIKFFSNSSNLLNLRAYLKQVNPNEDIIDNAIESFLDLLDILIYDFSLIYEGANNLAEAIQNKNVILTAKGDQNLIESYKRLTELSKERLKFIKVLTNPQFHNYNELLVEVYDIIENGKEYEFFSDLLSNVDIVKQLHNFDKELRQYQGKVVSIQSTISSQSKDLLDVITHLRRYVNEVIAELESFSDFLTLYGSRPTEEITQIFYILLKILPIIEDYNQIINEGEAYRKLSYFCDLFTSLSSLLDFYPFVFHQTLFQSPTLKATKIMIEFPGTDINPKSESIPSYLVFYDLLPGTWNYRFGRLLKSPCKEMLIQNFNFVSLDRIMDGSSSEFSKLRVIPRSDFPDDLPASFIENNSEIIVYFPKTIAIERKFENPYILKTRNLVLDNDDIIIDQSSKQKYLRDGNLKKLRTMPNSYPLYWYNIIYEDIKNYTFLLDLSSQEYKEITNKNPKIELLLPSFMDKIFESINFSHEFNVIKYVWGVSRTYGDKELNPLRFYYKQDSKIAFLGNAYNTDGMIFKLRKEVFDEFWDEILKKKDENPIYNSLVSQLCCQTIYNILLQEGNLNPFEADIIFQIYLFSYLDKKNTIIIEPRKFLDSLKELDSEYISNLLNIFEHSGVKMINLNTIKHSILTLKDLFKSSNFEYDNEIKINAYKIFLHTIAHKMLTAAKRFLGVSGEDINYFFNVTRSEIYLFDSVEGGNGSCETLNEYLYIPKIERKFRRISNSSIIYPSSDFLSEFEESLQECKYSQSGKISFDLTEFTLNFSDVDIPNSFLNLEPDIKVNFQEGLINLIIKLKNYYPKINFNDLYIVQKCPVFFLNKFHQDGVFTYKLEKLEAILDICTVGCIECTIDTFSCIYGFINSTEKINSSLTNRFYYYMVSKDLDHYAITGTDLSTFYKIALSGKDENPSKPSQSYYIIDRNTNKERFMNYKFLKKNHFFSYIYINKGLCKQDNNRVKIIGSVLRKIEGERIK